MEPLQTDLVPDITSVSRRQHFLTLSCRLQADTRCEATSKTAEAAIMALLRAGLPLDVEGGEVIKFGVLKGRRKVAIGACLLLPKASPVRSEEHTSELQSLMRISYAVFRLKT